MTNLSIIDKLKLSYDIIDWYLELQKCFNYLYTYLNCFLEENMKIKEIIVVEGKDDTRAIQKGC